MKNQSNLISKKELLTLLCLYSLGHVWIIFLYDAKYWDDWIFYSNKPSEYILDIGSQIGSAFNIGGYLGIVINFTGTWFAKAITFLSFFICGLYLRLILNRYKLLNNFDKFSITLLFLVLPFYMARGLSVTIGYSVTNLLFFMGWYYINKSRRKSLLFFFLSFTTNSFLVFYTIPIIEVIYYEIQKQKENFRKWNLIKILINNIDYLILPFVYFYIKITYFKPYGLYENYNKIDTIDLLFPSLHLVIVQAREFAFLFSPTQLLIFVVILPIISVLINRYRNIRLNNNYINFKLLIYCKFKYEKFYFFLLLIIAVLYFKYPFLTIVHKWVFSILVLATIIFLYKINKNLEKLKNIIKDYYKIILLMLIGIVFIAIALTPYLIVGHAPVFIGWGSRHQLLLPLGGAVLVLSIILLLQKVSNLYFVRFWLLTLTVSLSISFEINTYAMYYADKIKQQIILEFLISNNEIRNSDLIVFNDQSENLNVFNRSYSTYEWNHLMKLAYGDEKRLGLSPIYYQNIYFDGKTFDQQTLKLYGASEHIVSDKSKILFVEIHASSDLSFNFWKKPKLDFKIINFN